MKEDQIKKIDPIVDWEQWEEEADELARDFCPSIYPCKKCGHPIISGYCCTFCGDSNPNEEEGE
jgi:hypothetical protein